MLVSEFDYHLPKELIAQEPTSPRDHCRLMALIRSNPAAGGAGKRTESRRFFDLPEYLRPGDLLVLNNSKVFKARLRVQNEKGERGELFLLRPKVALRHRSRLGGRAQTEAQGINSSGVWEALAKPGRKFTVGARFVIDYQRKFSPLEGGDKEGVSPTPSPSPQGRGIVVTVISKLPDGRVLVDFGLSPEKVIELANQFGSVPVPPYIKKEPSDAGQYQTVYAKPVGSVAAPTAGFHFTPELLFGIRDSGVGITEITLHVGLGTFRPVQTDRIEDHVMHAEWVEISSKSSRQVNQVKQAGGRVIAVGTTVVRALEAVAQMNGGKLRPYVGDINIFITPGFRFQITDSLITNFHLPKSTLLMLVSAFAGREFILRAYEQAIHERYKFFSFGDAMLIQ